MSRTGKIIQIDELIAAHWGTCDVRQGETPEDYASRHEEARVPPPRSWILLDEGVWFACRRLDQFFRTEGA